MFEFLQFLSKPVTKKKPAYYHSSTYTNYSYYCQVPRYFYDPRSNKCLTCHCISHVFFTITLHESHYYFFFFCYSPSLVREEEITDIITAIFPLEITETTIQPTLQVRLKSIPALARLQ